MRSKMKSAAAIAACFLLCSCSGCQDKADKETGSENQIISYEGIPSVYIETTGGSNKFASEPVDGYVSSLIASWTPGYVIPPEPYYEECSVSVSAGDKTLLDAQKAKIKVRGNWTTNYEKKPFRLEFDEKQNLLGLNGGDTFRTWVLLAEYKDASLLRNKSALEISRDILAEDGLYASDAAFAELYLNNEYWGLYLIAEQQQVNSGRVKITKPEKEYQGTDIGYFIEFDGNFFLEDPLQQFHVDYCDNAGLIPFDGNDGSGYLISCLPSGKFDDKNDVGFTVKNTLYSQAQHDFIENFVTNTYRIMYEAAYNDTAYVFNKDYSAITKTDSVTPEEAVKKVVDVQSLADMYIISELTCDADLYWSSFYMTADFGPDGNKKLTFQAPWDFDSAMGNKSRCPDGTGFYAAGVIPDVNGFEYNTVNPWLAVLSYEDWYQDIIKEKWTSVYDRGVFKDAVDGIRKDTSDFSEAFERNNNRWGISTIDEAVTDELSDDALNCSTHKEASEHLADWLSKRTEFMNDYWHK